MMTDVTALTGVQVLILEDDYYQATDLQEALEAANAIVIGPFGDEAEAARSLAGTHPACAFIDVNLGAGPSFELPRKLLSLSVPFVFVTGYDAEVIPDEFVGVPRCEKPVGADKVIATAICLLQPGGLAA